MILTSTANERIKHARRVREGRERGLLFIEGERLVEEAVAAPALRLITCFHTPTPSARMAQSLAAMSCERIATDDAVLASLSDTQHPQGIIALAERPCFTLADLWKSRTPPGSQTPATTFPAATPPASLLLVALDRVQDPGNLGTLIRTAEAAGAHGLIALAGSADAYSPKALRSAMGSAFRLPIITDVAAESLLDACAAHGLRVVAAAGSATTLHHNYDWTSPTLLLLGNEGRGVSDALLARCDAQVRIPLQAPVESLNVAAAGAVLLFEAARQRSSSQH